jgi:hypothetical protein
LVSAFLARILPLKSSRNYTVTTIVYQVRIHWLMCSPVPPKIDLLFLMKVLATFLQPLNKGPPNWLLSVFRKSY